MATGFDVWDQSKLGEYGGGQIPDVISGLQFERLVNASGPTSGKVLRPSDDTEPKTVVFVACVGSRDPAHGHPYCSKVCCMYTAKHALLLKEKVPDAKAYIFYMDIRANGKGYEEFVQRVVERYDATYVRGRVSRIYPLDGQLVVKGADTLLGKPVEVQADMVVLATAMEPRADAKEMARKLGMSTDQDQLVLRRRTPSCARWRSSPPASTWPGHASIPRTSRTRWRRPRAPPPRWWISSPSRISCPSR